MLKGDYEKGRGAQFNPINRFLKNHVDNDSDGVDDFTEEKRKTQVFLESPKSIVSINDSPDLKMMNSINPYQGCEHGCVYCFARPAHEYWGFSSGLDFESKIIVKRNAAALLERTLLNPKWKVSPILLSGNTDAYQPLEKKYEITRSLLKVFLKYRHPVTILTKNVLVERDIDLLIELNKFDLVHIYFSITTLNEILRRKMEPRTTTTTKKLKLIKKFIEVGIPVGVMVAPIIPGLNHHEIPQILEQTAEAGAQNAGYTVVRLNGGVGEIMKDWLKKNYADRADKVINQVKELHGGDINDSEFGRRISGSGAIADVIKDLFDVSIRKYYSGISMRLPNNKSFRRNGHYVLFG